MFNSLIKTEVVLKLRSAVPNGSKRIQFNKNRSCIEIKLKLDQQIDNAV